MNSVAPRVAVFILFMVGAFVFSVSGGLPTAAYAQQRETSATVTRVVDGDTIEISPAIGGIEDVRLIGVDTPETVDPSEAVEPYGPEASQFTTSQLEGERVSLEFDEEREDRYGRLLAYVHVGGDMFNETLLRQGYAQLYIVPPNDKYEVRFEQAQQQARNADRGLWGLPQSQLCQLTDRGNGIGEGSPGCEGTHPPGDSPGGSSTPEAGGTAGESADAFRCELFLRTDNDRRDFAGRFQYLDDDLLLQRIEECREREVLADTIPDRKLPDTGGPPLLLAPWLFALVAAGVALLRRSTPGSWTRE